MEANSSVILNLPNTLCINQTIPDLASYAPIPGGVFSGSGVTNNAGTYSFSATQAGVGTHQISYTYTNNIGCDITIFDQIQVVNSTLSATASASSLSVCNGQSIALSGVSSGANSFVWNPGNLNGSTVNTIVNSSTLFTLTTTNAAGCIATASVSITASPQPVVTVTSPVIICNGQQVNLVTSGATNYSWSPTIGLSSGNGSSVIASPTSSTTYTVSGSNVVGCSASASTTVTVSNCLDCSTGTNLIGNISTSPASGAALRIPSNITISGNVTFTNNNVKILPGNSITVLPNATLNIVGSHFFGCESMWEGIKVQSGGKVNIQPYVVSSIIQKTTLIEDALIGIDYLPITTLQTTPVLQVNHATFNKNNTSIRIQGYTFSNPNSIFSIKNSLFTCRQIYNTTTPNIWPKTGDIKITNGTTDPLDKPYINSNATTGFPLTSMKAPLSLRSNVGLLISNVGTTSGSGPYNYNELIIGSTTAAEYNLFDNLNGGIDVLNSNITVQNCKFQDPKKLVLIGIPTGFAFGVNTNCNNLQKYRAQVMNECAFYNMNRAVKIDYYNESLITGNTIRSQRTISHSASASNYYIPGRYGIYIRTNDYRNITMTNNTLYNIEKGIYVGTENVPLSSSPIIIIEQNTISASFPGFPGVNNSVFDAIQLVNVNSLPYPATVNVFSNALNEVYRGILLQTWNRSTINVSTNTLTMLDQANDPEQYGIAFKNVSGGAIKNTISLNFITGFTGSTTYSNTSGIKIESSFSNHLECNNVFNTFNGLHFKGNTTVTSTKRNTMNNNKYGFVLDGPGVSLGDQGASNAPCDNIWSGTTWDPTGTVNGEFKTLVTNGANAVSSEMYVRSTNLALPSSFNPNGSAHNISPSLSSMTYSPINSALFTAFGVATSCNSAYIPEDSTLVMEATAAQMEMTVYSIESSTLTEEELAKQETDVYRSLDASPELLDESLTLQEFYDSTTITNKGSLLNAEKAYATGNVSLTETILSSISPYDQIEYNYKLFYLLSLKNSDSTFTQIDSLDLHNLAIACPDKDGNIVYQARSLYNSIFASAETFESNCNESPTKSLTNFTDVFSEKEIGITIYPNPNNGEFLVYVTDESVTSLTAILRDVSGKLLYNSSMEIIDNKLKLSYLAKSGIYYLELINPVTNNSFTEKIIILK